MISGDFSSTFTFQYSIKFKEVSLHLEVLNRAVKAFTVN